MHNPSRKENEEQMPTHPRPYPKATDSATAYSQHREAQPETDTSRS